MSTEDLDLKILRLIEAQPDLTQRQLAGRLGVSLGKANYCLQQLVHKGWVKTRNFKNSRNKLAYVYLLTPTGVARKADITKRFLVEKLREYERLKDEIEQLKQDITTVDENNGVDDLVFDGND